MPGFTVVGRSTRPQVEKIVAHLDAEKAVRGHIIKHQTIAMVIEEGYPSARYQAVVSAWKIRMLNERGIAVISEKTVGYRLAEADEQLRYGVTRVKSAVRQMGRGAKTISHTPDQELNEINRRHKLHAMTQITPMIEHARSTVRAAGLLLAKPEKGNA